MKIALSTPNHRQLNNKIKILHNAHIASKLHTANLQKNAIMINAPQINPKNLPQ